MHTLPNRYLKKCGSRASTAEIFMTDLEVRYRNQLLNRRCKLTEWSDPVPVAGMHVGMAGGGPDGPTASVAHVTHPVVRRGWVRRCELRASVRVIVGVHGG